MASRGPFLPRTHETNDFRNANPHENIHFQNFLYFHISHSVKPRVTLHPYFSFSFEFCINLKIRLITTATTNTTAKNVGPARSSKPDDPLFRISFARQWYVHTAYIITPTATTVNTIALQKPMLSCEKFKRPTARVPRRTLKFIQERKVRSLAKKTLGSTRTGRAIFLWGAEASRGAEDIL